MSTNPMLCGGDAWEPGIKHVPSLCFHTIEDGCPGCRRNPDNGGDCKLGEVDLAQHELLDDDGGRSET